MEEKIAYVCYNRVNRDRKQCNFKGTNKRAKSCPMCGGKIYKDWFVR